MVIKNKDGSEYKLRFPNPLMKAQDLWEPFEVHNMNFEELIIETKNVENKNKSNKLNIGKTSVFEKNKEPDIININEKLNQYSQENTEIITPISSVLLNNTEEDIIRPTEINDKLKNYNKTIFHCLPAIVKNIHDDLYQDKVIKISYGKKFTFESIVIEESDMEMIFWTHLKNIGKFSIIYPQNFQKRWWKIDNIKLAPEGFFLRCLPSDEHPVFTEN